MASDAPGDYNAPKGFSVSINLQDPNEAERIFKALSTGGKVTLPIGPTFWAERFGMVVDQYGIPWMINCAQAATKAAYERRSGRSGGFACNASPGASGTTAPPFIARQGGLETVFERLRFPVDQCSDR